LLRIISVNPPAILPEKFQAFVTTSQHAVQRLSESTRDREKTLWCVGSESAEVARSLGFTTVYDGGGSACALLRTLSRAHLSSPLSSSLSSPLPFLYLSGKTVRVDIPALLAEKGILAERVIVYETIEAQSFSAQTLHALATGNLEAVLFYSPVTAFLFNGLCKKARLEVCCKNVTALCLSEAIGNEIIDLPWKKTVIAQKTTTDDLLMSLMMAE
jgi:uroporphyrinogen-III synthase